ncbi:MAG: aldolase catalytic domain-containing protein [Cycloclasticus sp.]|nr:aldolase catalytic domain-containing protein [Cycloclasticus sp.]
MNFLDCTLRDGGYYNNWDFSSELVADYLAAMVALDVDYVEVGFRTLENKGFKGGFAFSSDTFLISLNIPKKLQGKVGVMVNGSELIEHVNGIEYVIGKLFTKAENSQVSLVRIACHIHQFEDCLPAATYLKKMGYRVGFNLMQIADCDNKEITRLAKEAGRYPIDVLYFADSMGSLLPAGIVTIIQAFRRGWSGELGVHTHDNMGNALTNTLTALDEGVKWLDATVTGMGRGPGNAKTEYLAIELKNREQNRGNISPLLELIRNHFSALLKQYCWGSNAHYYLAGKYKIHPSYVQEMLNDSRYDHEDILAVIDHLKSRGGKQFNLNTLELARHFFVGEPKGKWIPSDVISGREVLVLGPGPSVKKHQVAIRAYIQSNQPYVIALNTMTDIEESLIDVRAACHPVRLLADSNRYFDLPQPLITPFHMLPNDVRSGLGKKQVFDFGLAVDAGKFEFQPSYCIVPSMLVVAYALAIATAGQAKLIYLAGFDGYSAADPRKKETDDIIHLYEKQADSLPVLSITPSLYDIPNISVYSL